MTFIFRRGYNILKTMFNANIVDKKDCFYPPPSGYEGCGVVAILGPQPKHEPQREDPGPGHHCP